MFKLSMSDNITLKKQPHVHNEANQDQTFDLYKFSIKDSQHDLCAHPSQGK